jgi:hypothetical protein
MIRPETVDCPFCGRKATFETFPTRRELRKYSCKRCGQYALHQTDYGMLANAPPPKREDYYKISALCREQHVHRRPPFLLMELRPERPDIPGTYPITVKELLAKWPRTVGECLDRSLLNLAAMSDEAGQPLRGIQKDPSLYFARSEDEAEYYHCALRDSGYLAKLGSYADWVLTPNGWERVAELTRTPGSPDSPAFVAMWFGKETDESDSEQLMSDLYNQGIRPAIEDAGYKATRVDLEQFNDYIMDEVLALVRAAPFVVADFTHHRNGVYYEAGFAKGLGTPVICCCRSSELKDAHFDTKQLNHLRWDKPEDLRKILCDRILGTIGRGPWPAEAGRSL